MQTIEARVAVLRTVGVPRPYQVSRPLSIETVELDPPGPEEVLVEILAAGLCHSDLSVIDGNRPRPVPMALGHECAARVSALGADVSDLSIGDLVIAVFVPSCRVCEPCVGGRPALCEPGARANGAGTLLSGARRLHRGAESLHHHLGVSAFGTHAVVSRRSLVRPDVAVPPTVAALMGCAVLTGVGAVVNTARIDAGARVAIVGLGGVGLAALLGARAAGASVRIAVDPSADKRQLALELGATHVFDPQDPDAIEALRSLTRGGVDAAFEMAGVTAALEFAWRATRRGGSTVVAGLAPPAARFALSPVELVAEERALLGSYLGGGDPMRDIPKYLEWYRAGQLPVERLVSAELALEDINQGFDALADGRAVRQIVRMA